jgi:hypothetical protein
MHIERHDVTLTTIADGSVTAYTPVVTGPVLQVRYVPDATAPLDTGADLTITSEVTGVAIATLTDIGTTAFTRLPRQATHSVTGVALVYAAADPVAEPVFVAGERIKVVVAQGGNVKIGVLSFWVG